MGGGRKRKAIILTWTHVTSTREMVDECNTEYSLAFPQYYIAHKNRTPFCHPCSQNCVKQYPNHSLEVSPFSAGSQVKFI